MPLFRPRTAIEILREMIARVVARTPLTGLRRNGVIYHLVAAASRSDADQNFQLARLRSVWSIDTARGSDLDDRARDIQPGTVFRRQAIYATSTVKFSRPGTVGILTIPAGTVVGAEDETGLIKFRTVAVGSIGAGLSVSAAVAVVALEAGTRSNVSAAALSKMITRVAGVTAVTNEASVSSGQDRESDDSFIARLKDFIRSLPRGTVRALVAAARMTILPDGRTILFAHADEGVSPGYVTIYVDDGTGAIEEFVTVTSENVVASASGGERRFYTAYRPIRDDGTFVLKINTVVQVRDVDYVLDAPLGQVTLTEASYPAGLAPTDVVDVEPYSYYTGLIQEAQRIIDGDDLYPLAYPGYRAAGVFVAVRPPTTMWQTVQASISVLDGFNIDDVLVEVQNAIQAYVNGLDVGADVIVSELIEQAMGVPGMFDFRLTALSGGSANVIILDNQVARIVAGDIDLT